MKKTALFVTALLTSTILSASSFATPVVIDNGSAIHGGMTPSDPYLEYNGDPVNITNEPIGTIDGKIKINSVGAGSIDNSGLIGTADGGVGSEIWLSGQMSMINKSGGVINNSDFHNIQSVLNVNNQGKIRNSNFGNYNGGQQVNITNQSGAKIVGTMTAKSGVVHIDNLAGGIIDNAALTSDSGLLEIYNYSQVNTTAGNADSELGKNQFNAIQGGTLNFYNKSGALLSGNIGTQTLDPNSNINFYNEAGATIRDLVSNNTGHKYTINNIGGTITGTNQIENDPVAATTQIENSDNGLIDADFNMVKGSFIINNYATGHLDGVNITGNGTGTETNHLLINNAGVIENTIKIGLGVDAFDFNNLSGGTITGDATAAEIRGKFNFNNEGTIEANGSAIKITQEDSAGFINNMGTLTSTGPVISDISAAGDPGIAIILNNYGSILANGDPLTTSRF